MKATIFRVRKSSRTMLEYWRAASLMEGSGLFA